MFKNFKGIFKRWKYKHKIFNIRRRSWRNAFNFVKNLLFFLWEFWDLFWRFIRRVIVAFLYNFLLKKFTDYSLLPWFFHHRKFHVFKEYKCYSSAFTSQRSQICLEDNIEVKESIRQAGKFIKIILLCMPHLRRQW